MNFLQCPKCKLMLPTYKLVPAIATIRGQRRRIKICENCLKQIERMKNETKK